MLLFPCIYRLAHDTVKQTFNTKVYTQIVTLLSEAR